LEQLIVVRAGNAAANLWALDQALRCRAVAAVLAWPEKLDGRVFRRLQLAAEEGGGLGLLIRPDAARYDPSWADVRILVEPLPPTSLRNARRRLRLGLTRSAEREEYNT
jgi:protein ImuA